MDEEGVLMARPERLTEAQLVRVIKLHEQGIPIREIARRFEVSKTTLHKVIKKDGVGVPR